MTRRILTALGVTAMAVMLVAGPAHAIPSIDVTTTVTDAQEVVGCSGGVMTYLVEADISVVATGDDPENDNATVESVVFKWSLGGPDDATATGVEVVDDGGLAAGETYEAGDPPTVYHVILRVTVPCETETASVGPFIFLTTDHPGEHEDGFSSLDEFLVGGTAVPYGAIGMVGLAALAGGGLFVAQRRRRTATIEA